MKALQCGKPGSTEMFGSIRNCRGWFTAASLMLLTALSAPAYSQDYNDALRLSEIGLGSNARALGMGNAYTALSDDFSAASFNPAGFGLLRRMEFAGGINYSKYNNDATFFGNKSDYSNSQTKLDQLSFALPFPTIRGSFVVALGYSKDKDFNSALDFKGYNPGRNSMIQALTGKDDVSYYLFLTDATGDNTPISGRLQQSGTILSSGGLGKWSFSGAVEVARNVYVGGTLNLFSGSFRRTRDYYEDDVNNIYSGSLINDPENPTTDFQSFYLNDILDWDITGWDAKVGLLYQLSRFARFGASIKFPTSFTISEKYTTNATSQFASTTYTLDPPFESEIEYSITTPFIFSGGVSMNLMGLIASADVSYTDYTQMEFDASGDDGGLSPSAISANNRDIKDLFRGVANFNAGLEYRIPQTPLRVRGGFILNPSPFKGDASDFDKKYITAGAGFLTSESFAFDIGYAYGWWKDMGDNYGSGVSRTLQDVTYNNLIFTFSYRF